MSWREEIMRVVEDATFLPEAINGKARELDWLKNMGDWMISKKRYWGLALPIWVCEKCSQFVVIGSRKELKERAVAGWDQFESHSPHRPWIDQVKLRCVHCQGTMSRIPDVGNPWLDAGIVPYSTVKYNTDRAYWEKWFPADFITEAFPGQFRNWFYAILAMSTMMENKCPFKVLLGHAMVRDEKGEEMHKAKGNSIPFDEAAEKMGADLCRWLYCRQNPAANINFGYGPADEVRSKFTLKLWNTYAFFVNYARLDGFDPSAKQVPVKARPDIDRWILSDLQLLIRKARESFESYNVMAFCLEAEKFVDDKLSNWYVRRNRRRYWKSEHGPDKLAAYQTLHTVLLTLTKLFAPVMPFLAETMYQNLVSEDEKLLDRLAPGASSVHLLNFPIVDDELIDNQLSSDMEALLRLVSLGSAARNAAKIKVRQPLAEMKVLPGNESDRRAVDRFVDQIMEELNVKQVTLHDPAKGPLLSQEVKANMKTLGPKFGPRLKDVQVAITGPPAAMLAAQVQAGQPFELAGFMLDPADVIVTLKPPDGWAGVADRGTQVLVDTRITEELAREGMARDVIRQVQELRKKSKLDLQDRITLHLATNSDNLRQAIEVHKTYIAAETLVFEWANQPLNGEAHRASVKVDGQPLTIELAKVTLIA
jgi:isoleucyl-tRNA synthetase